MTARRAWVAGVLVVLGLATARLHAGGWAVVTMTIVPDHMIAGRGVTLSYAVRQHGVSLTPGLSGSIEAKDVRGRVVKAEARPGSEPGYYEATLTLPSPGDWTMTVVSGFWATASVPVPVRVIAAGSAPPAIAAADRGAQLFAAKGCATCHTHAAVAAAPGFAPDLSTPRFAPEFLKAFLADPSIKPRTMPNVEMPNLGLNDGEISALAVFLTTPAPLTKAVASR